MIRTFEFEFGVKPKVCRALFLPGGVDDLSTFGMLHDALEHGVLGFPFGFDGELMAVGAGFWRSLEVGPNFASTVFHQVLRHSPQGAEGLVGIETLFPLVREYPDVPRNDRVRITKASQYVVHLLRAYGQLNDLRLYRVPRLLYAGYLAASRVFARGSFETKIRKSLEWDVDVAEKFLTICRSSGSPGTAKVSVTYDEVTIPTLSATFKARTPA